MSYLSNAKTLVSHFGNFALKDITPKLISEYKVKSRIDGIKPATINRELGTMKRAFNLVIREWE